jgi:aminomethyltransferase
MSTPPPHGTQAIQRAFALLRAVADSARPLPLAELSRRVGLRPPTAHRILGALVAEGLLDRVERVERDGAGMGYCVGRRARALGALAPLAGQQKPPRTTPFFARELEHHASFGWRDWSGVAGATSYEPTYHREYWAIRNAAAIIDVSPLYKYEIRGPQAEALANRIFTRDFRKCRPGQIMYTCWLDDDGKLLQDGNVVRLAPDRFRVTAAHPTLRWFQDCGYGIDAEVVEVTEDYAALSVQGPRSRAVLVAAAGDSAHAERLAELPYFRAAEADIAGCPVLVTRTGFTGDLGYEVWIAPADAEAVWDALLHHGEAHGAMPVGLVAMDQARVEAGLVLIDIDFVSAAHALLEGRKSAPHEMGLAWTVKASPDRDFVGRAALERAVADSFRTGLVGIEVPWMELERVHAPYGLRPLNPHHPPSREPGALYAPDGADGGRQVGQVTSQAFSPLLKKQVGLASVDGRFAEPGTTLELEMVVDYKRVRANARVAKLPFYDPPHKRGDVTIDEVPGARA